MINGIEKLEAIIISVGRSEVLDLTLTVNKKFFHGAVVVAAPLDAKTQRVAKKHGASLLITDGFFQNGNALDVGLPHSQAMAHLKFKEWVVFMCPDIVINNHFETEVSAYEMDRNCIYGCDRVHVETIEETKVDTVGPCVIAEWGFGYFQMFHTTSRFLAGKNQICPSSKTPWMADYYFRRQFGDGHMMRPNGIWTWNPKYQRRLQTPCYHLKHGVIDTWKEFAPEWARDAF